MPKLSLPLRIISSISKRILGVTIEFRSLRSTIANLDDTLYAQQLLRYQFLPSVPQKDLESYTTTGSKLLKSVVENELERRRLEGSLLADDVIVDSGGDMATQEDQRQAAKNLRTPWRDIKMNDDFEDDLPTVDKDTGKILNDQAWRKYVRGEMEDD